MAALLEKKGELEEAHTLFERALVTEPTNLTAAEGKKRMEEKESAKADKNSWAIKSDMAIIIWGMQVLISYSK